MGGRCDGDCGDCCGGGCCKAALEKKAFRIISSLAPSLKSERAILEYHTPTSRYCSEH
jgi:hypothetical protein